MTSLRTEYVGKAVLVESVYYGQVRDIVGKLDKVDPYGYVSIAGERVPFVGYGCAIRQILLADKNTFTKNPTVLYDNTKNIPKDYDTREIPAVAKIVEKSFGSTVADEFKTGYAKFENDLAEAGKKFK